MLKTRAWLRGRMISNMPGTEYVAAHNVVVWRLDKRRCGRQAMGSAALPDPIDPRP